MFDRQEAEVMRQLCAGRAEVFGVDLVKQSGAVLSRGNVYSVLGRLEQAGWVTAREIPGATGTLPRVSYNATERGQRAWEADARSAEGNLGPFAAA